MRMPIAIQSSICVLLITLFVSCLRAEHDNSASLFSLFTNRKSSKAQIQNKLFNASELIIDESQLVGSSPTGQKRKDIIGRLPGQPSVNFNQYGGYVTVDPKTGKVFYYYFVEAKRSPDKSPLLIWINGGLACSSLGYGAMEEIGPFRVESDGKTLFANDYAWNQDANVLFWETPAGVGFSYSNTTSHSVPIGDKQTAIENYVFLLNWLERFPEFNMRDVYIAGRSIAGHYVPQLAQIIFYQNKKAKTIINLKGIMIGNPWIDYFTGRKGMFQYWGSHALISDDLTNQLIKYCGFPEQKQCDKVWDKAYQLIEQIDIHNIYGPLCLDSNLTDKPKKSSIFDFDPCSDYYVEAYLNSPDVQKELHANVTKIPYKWEMCNSDIQNFTDGPDTVLPILKELMMNGIRVWLYSGDVDAMRPVTGTQLAIKAMNLSIKDSWHPWYDKEEVGGYTQEYHNLTFATVRGAGYQVSSLMPQRALSLITSFLAGKPLPKS